MNKKIDLIIQARLGSKRLPNKVIANLNGIPMLDFLVKRIKRSNLIIKLYLQLQAKKLMIYWQKEGKN